MLRETWTDEINLSPRLEIQPKLYRIMNNKQNMDYADEHAKEKQILYASQYNKKAKHERFEVVKRWLYCIRRQPINWLAPYA